MRYVIGFSFAALAVWVLQATGILMALMMFLMIGQVPGTPISLPPTVMMVLLVVLMLGVAYWFFRQRPVRQIQEMKRAYHQQIDESPVQPVAKERRESLFMAGFGKSYASTWAKTYQWRRQITTSAKQKVRSTAAQLGRLTQPVRLLVVALSMIILIVSRELATWAKPRIRAAATWLRKQAGYSLKGTMLSAHKWSSLSKKLLSSLTSLLRRCSSVLKRGKSLLMRSAR
jgi:hypothetical protein